VWLIVTPFLRFVRGDLLRSVTRLAEAGG
jgi:hypothetical protein